jgi:hypothetical protein
MSPQRGGTYQSHKYEGNTLTIDPFRLKSLIKHIEVIKRYKSIHYIAIIK